MIAELERKAVRKHGRAWNPHYLRRLRRPTGPRRAAMR